jgi:hypothetical protein
MAKRSTRGYKKGSGKTGRKNMKRVEGGWQNQHGVVFTDEQRKTMERAVRKSNRQREKEVEADRQRPRKVAGEIIEKDKNQLHTMGKENEFIVSQQDKSMQRFKSQEDYENFMRKQEAIQSGQYANDRANAYRENFTKSLKEVYGKDAQDIVEHVNAMSPTDYIDLVAHDEVLEIGYEDSEKLVVGRLNDIRKALGIAEKDEWPNEIYSG